MNKLTYCLDKFLLEEISFLRKELGNKQKIIDNLENLLNDVTTMHGETNFSCKSLQIKTTSKKASNINDETIGSNRFSIAQIKNQLKVVKENLAAKPSDTSTIQNIDNFQNCNTDSGDDVNNQCNKSSLSLEGQQQEQEEIKKANLDRQLKEIRQQYQTVFNVAMQQPVQSGEGTKNISLENQIHHKWNKNTRLIGDDSVYLV